MPLDDVSTPASNAGLHSQASRKKGSGCPLPTAASFWRHLSTTFGPPLAAILWTLLALQQPAVHTIGPDVDSSWRWAINAPPTDQVWGRDIAFSYGPYGWIIQPLPISLNLFASCAFYLFATFLFASCAVDHLCRRNTFWLDGLLTFFVFLGAFSLGMEPDGFLFLCVALLCSKLVLPDLQLTGTLLSPFIGAFCGALLLVKFNIGLGATLTFACSLCFGCGKPPILRLATSLSGYAIGLLLPASLAFRSPSDLWTHLHSSWEISLGFSEAMSTPAHPIDILLLAAFLVILLAIGWIISSSASWSSPLAITFFLILPLLFLEFKHAFVRAARRPPIFFAFATVTLAVLLIQTQSPFQTRAIRLFTIFAFALGLVSNFWHGRPLSFSRFLPSPQHTFAQLYQLPSLAFPQPIIVPASASPSGYTSQPTLPPHWISLLSSSSVAVLPWKHILCPLNRLHCVLPPTLQLYKAYTPWLDRRSSSWITTNGPQFLLIHFPEIQGRHFFASAPTTWRHIRTYYDLYDIYPQEQLLLLSRRYTPRQLPPASIIQLPLNVDYDLSSANTPLVLCGDLSTTPFGTLKLLAFHLPLPELLLVRSDGSSLVGRIIPSLLSQGLELSDAPFSFDDLHRVLAGNHSLPPLVRARLTAPSRRWRQARSHSTQCHDSALSLAL